MSTPATIETINIIAAHSIGAKTLRCLAALTAPEPRAIALRARAPVASKAITIAEIAKRRVAEQGGRWFQYNVLASRDEPAKRRPDAEDPFVGAPAAALRAVPTLTIYLSPTRLPELAKAHGEQTGGADA